jgi:replicative DNA helicase
MEKIEQLRAKAHSEAKEIQNSRSYVSKRKLEREERLERQREQEEQNVALASKEVFDDAFSYHEGVLKQKYKDAITQHQTAVAAAIPFIDPVFDDYFKLTPGQLVTIAAYTGEGKSTNAVNIAAAVVKAGKRAIVFSNEEKSTDFMDMVACICEDLYHKDFVDQTMDAASQKRVMKRAIENLSNKLFICLDEDDTKGGTTRDEYVLNALQLLATAQVKPDVVVIDYLTNIYAVGSTSSDNHYFQLDRFLSKLKNLINKLPFPVVMCAQMHSEDKKKGQKGKPASLDTRIIMGGGIKRSSTIVIEVKAHFEEKRSTMTIHKNRKYKSKGIIEMKFDKGRLVHHDPLGLLSPLEDN